MSIKRRRAEEESTMETLPTLAMPSVFAFNFSPYSGTDPIDRVDVEIERWQKIRKRQEVNADLGLSIVIPERDEDDDSGAETYSPSSSISTPEFSMIDFTETAKEEFAWLRQFGHEEDSQFQVHAEIDP